MFFFYISDDKLLQEFEFECLISISLQFRACLVWIYSRDIIYSGNISLNDNKNNEKARIL